MSNPNSHEHEIEVSITCNIPTLRTMHDCVTKCYKNWAGGDPEEQLKLDEMRRGLYVILMDALLDNDLV